MKTVVPKLIDCCSIYPIRTPINGGIQFLTTKINPPLFPTPTLHLSTKPFSPHPLIMTYSSSSSSQSIQNQTDLPGNVDSNSNIYELIQAHEEKAARLPAIDEVRTVLDRSVRGMLSTFSLKYEGYPSGSMVDFACDADGSPILAISSLAVHHKDLVANPKCSLLVPRDPEDRTDLIITVHGDATLVSDKDRDAVRTAYLRRHPSAFWVDFGDFQFMRIEPKVVRYVTGVATALLRSGDLSKEEYKSAKVDPISQFSNPITSHMNKDHAESTKSIVQHLTKVEVDFAYMLDLDSLGINVKAGYGGETFKLRIPFPRRADDRKDVKTLIVEMLQAAKASN